MDQLLVVAPTFTVSQRREAGQPQEKWLVPSLSPQMCLAGGVHLTGQRCLSCRQVPTSHLSWPAGSNSSWPLEVPKAQQRSATCHGPESLPSFYEWGQTSPASTSHAARLEKGLEKGYTIYMSQDLSLLDSTMEFAAQPQESQTFQQQDWRHSTLWIKYHYKPGDGRWFPAVPSYSFVTVIFVSVTDFGGLSSHRFLSCRYRPSALLWFWDKKVK